MEKLNSLETLLLHEVQDLYSAEKQLVKALPKVAKKVTSPQLRSAVEQHLQQTEQHVNRLEQVFELLGASPKEHTCKAMKGLIKEGEDYVKAGGDDSVRDAGLIGAAQRVEHYEMAGYGTTRALAMRLNETAAAKTLQTTLDEEGAADKKLTTIAEGQVNVAASVS